MLVVIEKEKGGFGTEVPQAINDKKKKKPELNTRKHWSTFTKVITRLCLQFINDLPIKISSSAP